MEFSRRIKLNIPDISEIYHFHYLNGGQGFLLVGNSTQASGKSNVPYKETDFSGGNMDMVEWTAFDLSAGIKTGSNKVGVSTGLAKRFLYIVPRGKKELDLEGTDYPGMPGTIEISILLTKMINPDLIYHYRASPFLGRNRYKDNFQ